MEIYRTNRPVLFYLSIGVVLCFIIFLVYHRMALSGIALYSSSLIAVLYITLLRYSGTITLTETELKIKYILPFHRNIIVQYRDIEYAELWDNSYEHCTESSYRPLFSGFDYHNHIILHLKSQDDIDIKIHTFYGQICKAYRVLNQKIG